MSSLAFTLNDCESRKKMLRDVFCKNS
jgi:hypothetical protein